MKRVVASFFISVCLVLSACGERSQESAPKPAQVETTPPPVTSTFNDGPESSKGASWEYIVNNAQRTAEEYAVSRNPNAVFMGPGADVNFIKQYGGEFEGRYLLNILNRHGGNMSLVVLLPLFNENESSDGLDDEGDLWRVVQAKHNGKEF